jgi:hypothetical protein
LAASEKRREEDLAASEKRREEDLAASEKIREKERAQSDANLAVVKEELVAVKGKLAASEKTRENERADSDVKFAAVWEELKAMQAEYKRLSGQRENNNPEVGTAMGAQVSGGGSVVAVSVLNRGTLEEDESTTRDCERSGSLGGATHAAH